MSDPTIDAAREAVIASFEAQVEEVEASPEVDPEAAIEAVVAAEAQPVIDAPEATEQPPKPADATEEESRGYRRLLAREAKFREEQKAFELKAKQHEADIAAVAQFKAAQAKLKSDPIKALLAAGLTQAEVLAALDEARIMDLGDLAPPDVRANLSAKRAERIAREAEERLAAEAEKQSASAKERENQAFIAQYQSGITEFVGTGLTEYPHLAAMAAKGKPVAEAVWQTAIELASANPTGPVPTYAQVAAHLNSELADLVSAPTAPNPTVPVAAAAPTAPAGKPVLRNSSTSTQPGPAPERKDLSYDEYRQELRSKVLAKHGLATR